MKRYFNCICFALLVTLAGALISPVFSIKSDDAKAIIDRYYADVTGFGISKEDEDSISKQGCASTYGEITFEGADTLITYLKPTQKDVFVDAGSGVGKLTTHLFFSTDIAKSRGIELSKDRYLKAMQVKEALMKDNKIPPHRELLFEHGNILTTNLDDATIFFMCSTCFSDELMKKITDKLATLKPGLRVVTLRQLPAHKKFILKDTLQLPMTWSSSSSVYIYELVK